MCCIALRVSLSLVWNGLRICWDLDLDLDLDL